MSVIDKMNREYRRIKSIDLSNNTSLVLGRIVVSGTIAMDTNGLYTVFTLPAALYFEPHLVKFRQVGGTATSDMTASCGTGAGANDIFTATVFTGIRNINDLWMYPIAGKVKRCAPSDVMSWNISSFCTGTLPIGEATLYGELTV